MLLRNLLTKSNFYYVSFVIKESEIFTHSFRHSIKEIEIRCLFFLLIRWTNHSLIIFRIMKLDINKVESISDMLIFIFPIVNIILLIFNRNKKTELKSRDSINREVIISKHFKIVTSMRTLFRILYIFFHVIQVLYTSTSREYIQICTFVINIGFCFYYSLYKILHYLYLNVI